MKKSIFIISLCVLILGTLMTIHAQENMVEINNKVFYNPERPAAIFKHDAHNEAAEIDNCATCHHVYDDKGNLLEDESSEDSMCSDCHGLKASGNKPGLMKAFHLSCKGCHLEMKKGPILCGECHTDKGK